VGRKARLELTYSGVELGSESHKKKEKESVRGGELGEAAGSAETSLKCASAWPISVGAEQKSACKVATLHKR